MKALLFANRNLKELVRDITTVIFSIGFPIVLLLLLSAINKAIPEGSGPDLFNIEKLAPGVSVFGLSFLCLFSAMLISKDRNTCFMQRLFVSPLKPSDFILGYCLPMLPIAVLQSLVTYAAAVLLGLKISANILLAVVFNLPIAVVYIALGLLFGSILSEKAVGGICGALVTNLSAWVSDIWFDTSLIGGAFGKAADCLPFSHAVSLARYAAEGNYAALMPDLLWVLPYAFVLLFAAVAVFASMLKRN